MKAGRVRLARRQLGNWIRNLLPLRPLKSPARHLPGAYLRGVGVEVGALADPLRVPPGAHVEYLDRFSVEGLREQYPSLKSVALVPVDIVADGERLTGVADESRDFIIARHFLEHCQDPIATLQSFFRILKPGGIVYFSVPDKRYTFDQERPETPLAHLLEDHQRGPDRSRRAHYEEYVRCTEHPATEELLQQRVEELMTQDYSIHFHVWTQHEILELLLQLRPGIGFDIESFCKNRHEMICVLRKNAAPAASATAPGAPNGVAQRRAA